MPIREFEEAPSKLAGRPRQTKRLKSMGSYSNIVGELGNQP